VVVEDLGDWNFKCEFQSKMITIWMVDVLAGLNRLSDIAEKRFSRD